MRTTHSSTTEGASTGGETETSLDRDPQTKTPLDRDPFLEGTWDQAQTPPEGTWDQAARQEVTSCRDPPPDRMTDTRPENITLPQTSFAGGNNICDDEADLSVLIKIFGLISFIFMQFSANILSNIRFLPQTHGLTLPYLGNPGSVT